MFNLAQATPTLYSTPQTTASSGSMVIFWILYLVFVVALIVAMWKIFVKAGEKGWKALIPIYNTIILLKIVGYSPWYVLLFLVPFVNLVFYVIVAFKLAKAFGYGVGMTILEFVFGIGTLIIGFGDSKYLGTDGDKPSNTPQSSDKPSDDGPKPPASQPRKPQLVQ